MNEILTTVFLVLVIAMLVMVMVLIMVNVYEIFEEPDIQKRMRRMRGASQPWVTVLVYARDNEDTIEALLDSLLQNNYPNYDIIVVNDRSKDGTAKRINSFIKTHPKVLITLVNRVKRDTVKAGLEAGYKKSRHGKVVISLRTGINVPQDFIKRAVAVKDKREQAILRLTDPADTSTLSGITNTLSNFLWLRTRTITVSDPRHILPTKLDVRMDVVTVLLFLCIFCVSILTQETMLIWYSWVIVTSYLCAVIWLSREGLIVKIRLTFSAIPALFLLPVSSFLQGISQFRSRI